MAGSVNGKPVARQLSYTGGGGSMKPPLAPSPARSGVGNPYPSLMTTPSRAGTPRTQTEMAELVAASPSLQILAQPTLRERIAKERPMQELPPAVEAVHNDKLSPMSLRARLHSEKPEPPLQRHAAAMERKHVFAPPPEGPLLPGADEGAAGSGGGWDSILCRLDATNARIASTLSPYLGGAGSDPGQGGGAGSLGAPTGGGGGGRGGGEVREDGSLGVQLGEGAGWVWRDSAVPTPAKGAREELAAVASHLRATVERPSGTPGTPAASDSRHMPSSSPAPPGGLFTTPTAAARSGGGGGGGGGGGDMVTEALAELDEAGLHTVARHVREGISHHESSAAAGAAPRGNAGSSHAWGRSPLFASSPAADLEAAGLHTVARDVRRAWREEGAEGGPAGRAGGPAYMMPSPAGELEAAGLRTVARALRAGEAAGPTPHMARETTASTVRARLGFDDNTGPRLFGDRLAAVRVAAARDGVEELQGLETADTVRRVERALDEMSARLSTLVSPGGARARPSGIGLASHRARPVRASPSPAPGAKPVVTAAARPRELSTPLAAPLAPPLAMRPPLAAAVPASSPPTSFASAPPPAAPPAPGAWAAAAPPAAGAWAAGLTAEASGGGSACEDEEFQLRKRLQKMNAEARGLVDKWRQ